MRLPLRSACSALLGVFIVAQLLFLFSANLLGFLQDTRPRMTDWQRHIAETIAPGWPHAKGPAWNLASHLAKADRIWGELTGQTQSWSLFAPIIGRECVFPALEVRWHDADPAELVLSDNEPPEPNHFIRIGNYRMRRYESNLCVALTPDADETPEQTHTRWRDAIRQHATDYAQIIRGYLRWRLDQIMARRPGRDVPRQVTLVMRRYHINDYGAGPPYWDGPFTVPVARTQGNGETLEWFDPAEKRYHALPEDEHFC